MNSAETGFRRAIALVLLLLLLGSEIGGVARAAAPAPAPADDAQLLKTAWLAYEENDYLAARRQADEVIAHGRLADREMGDAWILKGLCETDLNNHEGAIQAFLTGLRLKPDARVEGAAFIPQEIAYFNEALELWRRENQAAPPTVPAARPAGSIQPGAGGGRSLFSRPAFLLPAGIVVVGGVVALLLGKGEDSQPSPLPGLPSHP